MSGKDSHVPLVPPVPLGICIWERFACSTCSTWCLCLRENRMFHGVSMSERDSHFPLVPPTPTISLGVYFWKQLNFPFVPPVPPIPLGFYVKERFHVPLITPLSLGVYVWEIFRSCGLAAKVDPTPRVHRPPCSQLCS